MARALAKKPDDRFTRAGDFGRALSVVAQRSQRVLPSLPEALRQEWVDGSPQPLAESVALLEVACPREDGPRGRASTRPRAGSVSVGARAAEPPTLGADPDPF